MTVVRRRILVRGRVQGVCSGKAPGSVRSSWASGMGVRNRPDGAVEAELEGDSEDVDVLVGWFAHGPAQARVDSVAVEERAPVGGRGFSVA